MIAHPHPVVIRGVAGALAAHQDIDLVSTTTEICLISSSIRLEKVDILLCAYEFESDRVPDGLYLLRRLRREHPALKIVVFTNFLPDSPLAQHSRELGVSAVLSLPSMDPDSLVIALKGLVADLAPETDESDSVRTTCSSYLVAQLLALSPCELEVLRHHLRGLSDEQIATRRKRARKTVSNQRNQALRKLRLANLNPSARDDALSSLGPWLVG